MKRFFFTILLSFAIHTVYGDRTQTTLQANSTYSICSKQIIDYAQYTATIESPGIYAVYLIGRDQLNNLLGRSNSTDFEYWHEYSCDQTVSKSLYTSCTRTATGVERDILCIALRNRGKTTVKATVDFSFDRNVSAVAPQTDADGSKSSNMLVTIISVSLSIFLLIAVIAAIVMWRRRRRQHPDKSQSFQPLKEPELKQKIPKVVDENDSNLKPEFSSRPGDQTGLLIPGSGIAAPVNPFADPNIYSHQSVCSDTSNKDTLYAQSSVAGYPQAPKYGYQQPIYIPVYVNNPSQIPQQPQQPQQYGTELPQQYGTELSQQYGTEFFPGLYEMPVPQHYIDPTQQANLTDTLDKTSAQVQLDAPNIKANQ